MRPAMTPEQRERTEQRRSLELARARAEADLQRATAPAHRRMLQHALDALRAQIDALAVPEEN